MSFRQKLDAKRLFNGALLLGAIALAWAIERPQNPRRRSLKPIRPAGPSIRPIRRRPVRMRWAWWRAVLLETYEAMSKDRLLAVAAGVVFYALLAIFPAITALVSSYGLFADAARDPGHLSMLANVLPAGGISIVQEQITRIAAQPSGLSVGFAVGLAGCALERERWRQGDDRCAQCHRRSGRVPHLRAAQCCCRSTMTLGAIVFLLLAVGAVVAFPLVMSTFGLKDFTARPPG